MKNVLHLLFSNKFAGAENIAITIINNLKDEFNIYYSSQKGDINRILKNEDINDLTLDSMSIIRIKKLIKDFNMDIIHAHDFKASFISVLLPIKKRIAHIHQSPDWLQKINLRMLLFMVVSTLLDKVIFCNEKIVVHKWYLRIFNKKIIYLNNVIDPNHIIQKSQSTKDYLNQNYIVYVGRLEEVKNPLKAIKVFNLINKIDKDVDFYILGDGSLRKECEELINELNLKDKIHLIGSVDNPYPFIKNAKALLLTSISEGLPMVIIESMVLQTPILSNRIDTLIFIEEKKIGYLCNDFQEYVEAYRRISVNPSESFNFFERNIEAVKNFGEFIKKVKDLYLE